MPAAPTFTVRTVQLVRALFAAAAALMVTFSPDHSAAIGLAVFSGFAIGTGIVHFLSAWLVYPQGRRAVAILLGVVSVITGMAAGVPDWRSVTLFFVLIIVWAVLSGLIELIAGLQARRRSEPAARDEILAGALTLLLAVAVAVVPAQYSWDYSITGAGDFTLTGIILAVGMFGAYAALIAVFLGIAGFSPRRSSSPASAEMGAAAPSLDAATENRSTA